MEPSLTGYCMRCRQKMQMRNMKRRSDNPHIVIGTCDKCGTKMARIISLGKQSPREEEPASEAQVASGYRSKKKKRRTGRGLQTSYKYLY